MMKILVMLQCWNISHLSTKDETQTKDTDGAGGQRDISVSATMAPAGEWRRGWSRRQGWCGINTPPDPQWGGLTPSASALDAAPTSQRTWQMVPLLHLRRTTQIHHHFLRQDTGLQRLLKGRGFKAWAGWVFWFSSIKLVLRVFQNSNRRKNHWEEDPWGLW